ncbi:MAG: AMP-binding protein [Proteobacteria bacterium]|nr:AMP-binding protein [Pseudomonadota bacterium]MCP4919989.1 AMP-binding protein [Pseudomonadota bacterium]
MSAKQTVMQVFDKTAATHANKPALKVKRGGSWKTWTWAEYQRDAKTAAKALIHLGLQKQTGISIIGYNSPEWAIADIGAIYAGGFPAGIYTTNSPKQCKYITEHSDSVVAFAENAMQAAKFHEIWDELPKCKALVIMDDTTDEHDYTYSWSEFMALADNVDDAALQERVDGQDPEETCTFIYTSGTTGSPKAVMITHDNITWTAESALATINGYASVEQERVISYLPLSHIAEQLISLHFPVACGGCTYFAESLEKLGDNLREVRPTMFLGVPRVWEKIQAKIVAGAAQNSGMKKKIGAWAKGVGLEGGYAAQNGESLPFFYGLANKLVFSKVREALGLDQCRVQITSAAPISKSTLEFFLSLGVPIMEVYGMSECTGPATLSLPTAYKTGSVGWVLPGGEIKIAPDGEICMRGRHIMKGYYKNPEATAEAIDEDGWLHSGDLGKLEGKYCHITGRKKELIITAGGENIAPNVIEGLMKSIPSISQFVVIGDARKHLSALLTLDDEKLAATLAESGSPAKTAAEASTCDTFHGWMMAQVDEKNGELARVQKIKKIKVLPADFSVDGGELTPTMKVKRKVVNEKYSAEIEAFYA